MSTVRPLPARPSLEFDRKEAKALLRLLKASDPHAIIRAKAQYPGLDTGATSRITLAIAQLTIAREYGFSSWARLVQYHADLVRQRGSFPSFSPPDWYEEHARSIVAGHARRGLWAGRVLAAYVPRFYGMPMHEVFDHAITDADARLAVARSNSCPSWDVLMEGATEEIRSRSAERSFTLNPWQRAGEAMDQADLKALEHVVREHPELLHPSDYDVAIGRTLLHAAYGSENRVARDRLRPIVDWLAAQGQDLQGALNAMLHGKALRTPADVQRLIDRGADPSWIPPSGIPLLERVLVRWRSVGCADVVAKYVKPRDALWIAAGLGDVQGVSRFLDANGKPTAKARALRPPLDANHGFSIPVLPEPSDDEILYEAFWVAALNQRIPVMEYMISRGFDVNYSTWGPPIVNVAVGNAWTEVVECLVRAGADLDIHEGNSNGTARDMARAMYENGSHGPSYRRIVELCGLDPDAILAARDAKPSPAPELLHHTRIALQLAIDDAHRQGQSDVRPENLLFGLLRLGGGVVTYFTLGMRPSRQPFFADFEDRVNVGDAPEDQVTLPMHPDAQAIIDTAIQTATARRRERVGPPYVLHALALDEYGVAATLLERYGSSRAKLLIELERSL